MRRALATCFVSVVVLLAGACGGDSGDAAQPAPGPTTTVTNAPAAPVVRQVLASEIDPPGAPGRTLSLVRYTIAPGAQLPAHIHPGVQLASIHSGTLTYTVISGVGNITRAGGAVEAVTGPSTVTLGPGDAVTELGDMVHFGANMAAAPVVIDATLLTESGLDLAVLITTTTTP